MQRFPIEACSIFLLVCAGVSDAAERGANAPVEGDASILEILRDALVTNRSQYPVGELRAILKFDRVRRIAPGDEDRAPGPEGSRSLRTYHIYALWDRGQRFYKVTHEVPGKPLGGGEEVQRADGAYTLTTDSRGRSHLWIEKARGPVSELSPQKVAPDQWWYCDSLFGRGLDALLDLDKRPPNTVRTKITRAAGGIVRVVDTIQADGSSTVARRWYTCDLSAGGNFIEVGVDSPGGMGLRTRHFTWTEHAPGKWRLSTYREEFRHQDGELPWHRDELQITEFNPQPQIPPGRFTVESLDLTNIVRTTDTRGGTVKVRRTLDAEVSEDDLKSLGEQARKSGFAAPNNK